MVNSQDSNLIVNHLNAGGGGDIPANATDAGPYWDVNGDNSVTPLDALTVVAYLNASNPIVVSGATLYEYDALGRLTKRTDPNNFNDRDTQNVPLAWQYQYDRGTDLSGGVGHREIVIDPLLRKTETDYDMRGRLRTVVGKNSVGDQIKKATFTYDAADNMITSVDGEAMKRAIHQPRLRRTMSTTSATSRCWSIGLILSAMAA